MTTSPRVVIVGAGFGGLAAAKRLEREAVDVTVVDRHNFHTFLPLLYQVATAGLNVADVGYPIRGLFRRHQRVLFRKSMVTGVDWSSKEVLVDGEPSIPFDHLIISVGSSTNYFGVDGAAEHSFPLYALEDAIRVRNHMLTLFEAADSDPTLVDEGALNFVVVGGGPTGVEVSGALVELFDKVLEQDFHDLDVHRARVILVEQAGQLLTPFSPKSQRYARHTLTRRGVEVRLGTAVERIAVDHVELSSGEVIPTRLVVWAAGVKAAGLAERLGVRAGPWWAGACRRRPVDRRPSRCLRDRRHRRCRRRRGWAPAAARPGRHPGRHARRRADPRRSRRSATRPVPLPRQGHDGHDRPPGRGRRAPPPLPGVGRCCSTDPSPGRPGSDCIWCTSWASAIVSRC